VKTAWRTVALLAAATLVVTGCGHTQTTQSAAAFLKVLPGLTKFVEHARGLTFKHPTPVVMLSGKDFTKQLHGGRRIDDLYAVQDTEESIAFLRAFGLVTGPVDARALTRTLDANVAGFYDPFEERLFIRIADPTPYNQLVVVHELTHALDDQYFPLAADLTGEPARAWRALVEGSATAVEERFRESRPPEERRRIDDEERAAADGVGVIPDALLAQGSFPYSAGRRFVEALYARAGSASVDAAFRFPPQTTEQVLHPEKYTAKEKPLELDLPSSDGPRTLREGVLGEAGVRLLLFGAVDRQMGDRAAAGWGGDRYILWRDGARTCARVKLLMDTVEDTDEVLGGLRAWASKTPGATVQGSGPIVTTSCGDAG